MGAAQSYLSPEAAITVLVVAGAVGLGYTQVGPNAHTPNVPDVTSAEGASKKGKKKKQNIATADDVSEVGNASKLQPLAPRVVAFPEVIPGQFDRTPVETTVDSSAAENAASKSKKSKKKKGKATITENSSQPLSSSVDYLSEASTKAKAKATNAKRSSQTPQPQSSATVAPASASSSHFSDPLKLSTASLDTDSSWTRVGSRKAVASGDKDTSAEPTTSDAGIGTSQTGSSSPAAEDTEDDESGSFLLQQSRTSASGNRKTLAEKLLPKPRKTGVDDMLETPDYPVLSRVMRVQPLPSEKPASGFSWGDYEDVRVTTDGGENDADGEDDGWGVVASKRPKRANLTASASSASSLPTQKVSDSQTKKQRQNAQKREKEKASKAEAEIERLATLAKHKRELEKVRMAEQYKSGGKTPSGGMKAAVDERGKLVWE